MRNKGTFEFSGNLEVRKDGPLEAKSLATNYTDLVKEENWTDSDGVVWVYPGLNVTCKDRPGKIYQLASNDYTNEDNWIPIGDTSEISSKLQDFINSKGSANGIASLDEQGVVPSAQLPSYVDDVIDVYATYDKSAEGVLSNIQLFSNQEKTTPITPESGKIYIDVEGNYQFRWTGTIYTTVGAPTVLGEVTGTAYDGGKGKALSDKINKMSNKVVVGPTTVEAASDTIILYYETHKTSTNADEVDSHTINAATTSKAGVMSATDKAKLDSAGKAKALASATSGQWIRFAELAGSMYNSAIITVKEGTAGATFILKKALNKAPVVKILDLSDNIYLTKIRVCTVLNGDSTGFLDVYVNTDSSNIGFNIGTSIDINLVEPSINGSTEGYNIEEVSLI
jgi:hypothetical protein